MDAQSAPSEHYSANFEKTVVWKTASLETVGGMSKRAGDSAFPVESIPLVSGDAIWDAR
jgi:hypothetical protein